MTQINRPNFGYTNGINNLAGVKNSDLGPKVGPKDKLGETTVKDVTINPMEMVTNEIVQWRIDDVVAYAQNSGSDLNLYEFRSMMNKIMFYVKDYNETLYENAGSLDIHIEFEFNGKKYSINCNYKGEVKNPYPATNTNVDPKDNDLGQKNTGNDFGNGNTPKRAATNQESMNIDGTDNAGKIPDKGDDDMGQETVDPVSVKINNLISMCENGYRTLKDVREVLDYLVSQDSIDGYGMSIENGVATISFKFAAREFKLQFNADGNFLTYANEPY